MTENYITVPEAARRLGITRQAVHKLVQLGRVQADKIGRDWLIPAHEITLPWNKIRTPPRRGFSLIEVALSLGIAGLALVAMEQGADDANRQVKDAATADDLSQVYTAAEQYIKANPGLAGTMTIGTPVQVPVGRTSSTAAVPAGSLQALGFLPADYVNSNPYGQTHVVVLRSEANNIVEALVETTGGAIIHDVDLGRIAAKVGANGGVVDSNPPPGVTAGTMQGTGGGWSEAATAWTASGLTPSAGHPIAVSYATQTDILEPWLYRNAVPGQPEANRMHTAIDMTHNSLNAVSNINNTDQATGVDAPVTVGSELVGNTVNNSQVNFQNGLMACKGNTTGCTLSVSDDGGFVDNNDGWVTYKGAAAGGGLKLAGAGDNLAVGGTTTTTGVTTANGGLVAQDYIQSYGDVQMKRTATHLAALTWPDASGNWSGGAYMAPDTSTGFANLMRIYGGNLKVDGAVVSSSDYSNIYYDAANSNYYMQPSGTSVVNNLDANSVYDFGNLVAGNGALSVYQTSNGTWELAMTGQIYASGPISSGSSVTAGTSMSAGSSVSAGTTMEAAGNITSDGGNIAANNGTATAKGLTTTLTATLGAGCSIAGEMARDSSTGHLDWCQAGVWSNPSPQFNTLVFDTSIPSGYVTQNTTGGPIFISAYTRNTCLNVGISLSGNIGSTPSLGTVADSQGFNGTAAFIVPAGWYWDTSVSSQPDGSTASCSPDLTIYASEWK